MYYSAPEVLIYIGILLLTVIGVIVYKHKMKKIFNEAEENIQWKV